MSVVEVYKLIVKGGGEGCDYTLGCNVKIVNLHSTDYDGALIEAQRWVTDYDGHIPLASVDLVKYETRVK